MYNDDFSKEGSNKWVPPEGPIQLEIASMKAEVSKSGNPMFRIHLVDPDDATRGFVQYFTNIKGKRFLLKQLINACGIKPTVDEEGVAHTKWDESMIEGKVVGAKLEHEHQTFIDRDGNERKTVKPRVACFEQIKEL